MIRFEIFSSINLPQNDKKNLDYYLIGLKGLIFALTSYFDILIKKFFVFGFLVRKTYNWQDETATKTKIMNSSNSSPNLSSCFLVR